MFEIAEDRCGRCGSEYCAECLVYAFGPKRPPFCIPCAVASAGIRSSAGRSLPRKELRRIEKERKGALKAARRAAKQGRADEPTPTPEREPELVSAMEAEPEFDPTFESELGHPLEPSFEPGFAPYAAS